MGSSMIGVCIKLMEKYRELFVYLIVGVLTTIVSLLSYYIFAYTMQMHYLVSNLLSWVCAVVFAYFTNKVWVFQNYDFALTNVVKEVLSFIGSRIATLGVDMLIMFVMVDMLSLQDMIAKITVQVVVTILNYVLSKFLVFKKG